MTKPTLPGSLNPGPSRHPVQGCWPQAPCVTVKRRVHGLPSTPHSMLQAAAKGTADGTHTGTPLHLKKPAHAVEQHAALGCQIAPPPQQQLARVLPRQQQSRRCTFCCGQRRNTNSTLGTGSLGSSTLCTCLVHGVHATHTQSALRLPVARMAAPPLQSAKKTLHALTLQHPRQRQRQHAGARAHPLSCSTNR